MKNPRTSFLALAAAALLMGGCASQSQMTASNSWPPPPAAGPDDEYSEVMPLTAGARPNTIPLVAGGYEQPY